jgi:hypothetical protein
LVAFFLWALASTALAALLPRGDAEWELFDLLRLPRRPHHQQPFTSVLLWPLHPLVSFAGSFLPSAGSIMPRPSIRRAYIYARPSSTPRRITAATGVLPGSSIQQHSSPQPQPQPQEIEIERALPRVSPNWNEETPSVSYDRSNCNFYLIWA